MASIPETDPHQGQSVRTGGVPLAQARAAVILVHGRGASPQDVLALAEELACQDCAYLAPQAAGATWYPYSFLFPLAQNEPWLSSALGRLDSLVQELLATGFPASRLALLGFSQGACLALEYAARSPRRYGAVIGLSGGLIGPPGTPRDYPGSLDGTPVFMGCSDVDPHIPLERVEETGRVLGRMGAELTMRIYPGLGHTVNANEIGFISSLLGKLGKL
jgi:predicted esterase